MEFNFIFEIGDYFKIIVQGILSIALFTSGVLVTRYTYNKRREDDAKELFDFFLDYLKGQSKSVKKQINEYRKFMSELEISNFAETPKYVKIAQPFFVFESLDKPKLRDAAKKNNLEPKELMNLFLTIELSKNMIHDVNTFIGAIPKRFGELKIGCNEKVRELHQTINQIWTTYSVSSEWPSEIKQLNYAYQDWTSKDSHKENFEWMMKIFINQTHVLFEKVYEQNPSHPYAARLNEIFTDIKIFEKEWLYCKDQVVAHLNDCLDTFENNPKTDVLYGYGK